MLPLLLAIIVFVVLALILVPLLRAGTASPDASRFDRDVYRDQLRELERDLTRGVLNESEAASARLEIQRRLLAVSAAPTRPTTGTRTSPIVAIAVAAVIALGSVGLYVRLGAPDVPDMPFASRKDDAPVAAVATALTRLKQRLDADPSNREAWLLYARAESELNHWDAAAAAFKRAIDLGQADPDTLVSYGEMLTQSAQGTVTPAARAAFAAALGKQPGNEAARYYTALAAGQDGQPAKAIELLQALLTDLPTDAPVRGDIGNRIAEAAKAAGLPVPALAQGKSAAPGPDAAAMEAAAGMPDGERQAMVRGMVERLATRLQSEPNDLDGWLRLGRAYGVLGDTEKSADAYDRAAALKPGDAGILLQGAQALLASARATDPLSPRTIKLLHRIESISPGHPAVLWYLGLAAAREAKPNQARGYWARLLANLPDEGEEAKTVKAAMEALRDK